MMLWLALIVISLCALHFTDASKGNPNPGMLKGKMARLRTITAKSALKESAIGLRNAPGLKGMLATRAPILDATKRAVNHVDGTTFVNVMVRRKNTDVWFQGRKLALDEDEANLGMVLMGGGRRSSNVQDILDKSIFNKVFGKRVGDPDFVADTRRREAGFAAVKSRDIEYGYQIDPKLPVFSLQKFSTKAPALKIQPVPQVCLDDMMRAARRKDLMVDVPHELSQGIDRLIDSIGTTGLPSLLVSSQGSAEMAPYDKRSSVCVGAGGAVVVTAYSRSPKAPSPDLRDSLLVRISNLHYLTANPPSPQLAPGLVGLVLTALVLDRYKQRDLEVPAKLRVQLQSDSFDLLNTLRNSEDLAVDPNEGNNNHARSVLGLTYLAQRLYVSQTLYPPEEEEGEVNDAEDEEGKEEEKESQARVSINTYLACEPAQKEDAERWSIQEKSMWMVDQLAQPRPVNVRAKPLLTSQPAARPVLQTVFPKWRENLVLDLDIREVLKWCAGLWDVIKRDESEESEDQGK